MSKAVYVLLLALAAGAVWLLLRRLQARIYEPGGQEGRGTPVRLLRSSSREPETPQEAPEPGDLESHEEHEQRRRGRQRRVVAKGQNQKERQLFCRLITPEKVLYEGEADVVVARIADGDIGILVDHGPVVSTLRIGEIRIVQEDHKHIFATSDGFFRVSENLVQILVEEALSPEDIDVDEAEHCIEEAEKELLKISPDGEEEQRKREEIERRRHIAENLVRVARKYGQG